MTATGQLLSVRSGVRLAPFTSLKVGGPAQYYVEVRRIDEALAMQRWASQRRVPWRWIGGGSNLLVADEGVEGMVARWLGEDVELPPEDQGEVVVGAGRSLPKLARGLARAGWSGMEWAANVPGTVGGAVVNNAGAFGSCVAATLTWAKLLLPDGQVERRPAGSLGYGYRTSLLKGGQLAGAAVVRAAFRIQRRNPLETTERVREFQRLRTASQPRLRSAGSVFANPEGDYAGRLIEAAGLKGQRLGGAQISEQHANFIVNLGSATARDVYQLMRLAQTRVLAQAGRWLRPEIELVGLWSESDRLALGEAPGLEPSR